ncbi:MAG: tetraacyldisaccharide 4'-kinase [Oligoflexia bacterium]|nr:tetraacyldisaccharide 4'-kinase [Oligoflexia bacterium]
MKLRCAETIYSAMTRLRNSLYDHGLFRTYAVRVPVISVGNLTAGGNAKTPLALWLAAGLLARGMRPAILTRGYRGRIVGPQMVPIEAEARDFGDEPVLMARKSGLPVVVARDRVAGARYIESQSLGDVIIMDDGFQHRRLARCFDLLAVKVGTPSIEAEFCAGRLLPAGLFRENRDLAMSRAQALIFVDRSAGGADFKPSHKLINLIPAHVKVFTARFEAELPYSLLEPTQRLTPGRVAAFCAIAGGQQFFSSLENLGFQLEYRREFPDHHSFSVGDLERLREEVGSQMPLICTEKDAVKLTGFDRSQLYVLPIQLRVFPADALLTEVVKAIVVNASR